ncbi:hypothetical protein ARHIZOSPH14_14480 [Agromyces rhizosphaerae]|uniref:DnaJ homologue subfamily C member 28 conserved domain-containing protein n=1 Tax=Agromyces rhizosphaerae TaxID=88374 RepID=A0A9W6CQW2_9MICO|nr:DUF1992 domain-containing protein [Agromyces rhizosphaerae]GLI27206.1 hypothetical protein ARHIZOSPH14_14480 [Agromyces rhizosphaerae]
MVGDARRDAWRYRVDRAAEEFLRERDGDPAEEQGETDASGATGDSGGAGAPDESARVPTATERAAYVETAIQQAMRRGEFDDLPGAGKPLEGLDGRHDPDWWIRRKIEREQLGGLGPPALTLRVEHAQLEERLDGMQREQAVRDALEDFNRRVIDARRQLLGGPPVVTPTRDVEAEVAAWRTRREERRAAAAVAAELERERQARRARERRSSVFGKWLRRPS